MKCSGSLAVHALGLPVGDIPPMETLRDPPEAVATIAPLQKRTTVTPPNMPVPVLPLLQARRQCVPVHSQNRAHQRASLRVTSKGRAGTPPLSRAAKTWVHGVLVISVPAPVAGAAADADKGAAPALQTPGTGTS